MSGICDVDDRVIGVSTIAQDFTEQRWLSEVDDAAGQGAGGAYEGRVSPDSAQMSPLRGRSVEGLYGRIGALGLVPSPLTPALAEGARRLGRVVDEVLHAPDHEIV